MRKFFEQQDKKERLHLLSHLYAKNFILRNEKFKC